MASSSNELIAVERGILELFRRPTRPADTTVVRRPPEDDLDPAPAIRAGYGKCSKCNCGGFEGMSDYCPCGHSFGDHW